MYEIDPKENTGRRRITKTFIILIIAFLGMIAIYSFFVLPPKDFPVEEIVKIEKGASLDSIAEMFEEKGMIVSADLFKIAIVIVGGEKKLSAGGYIFDKPVNMFEVARRVITADYGVDNILVTLQEGFTREEMADVLEEKLLFFNRNEFLFETKDEEGYLFPDTYFFFETATTDEVINTLRDTFQEKVGPLGEEIANSGHSLKDIITMASIIQKESYNNMVERQTISGILWKRISKGMRLQVDATLKFYTGKGSSKLTTTDLRTDHPYNTYTRDGLPPGPIGNPGLASIKAAINPISSPYYFYLHANSGQVYYAVTHDGHVNNKNNYLR